MDRNRRQLLFSIPAVFAGSAFLEKLRMCAEDAPAQSTPGKDCEVSLSGSHWFGHVPRKEDFARMTHEKQCELGCCVALELAAARYAELNWTGTSRVGQVDRALGFLRADFPEFFEVVIREYAPMAFDNIRRHDPPAIHDDHVGVHDPAGINWPTFAVKIRLVQSVFDITRCDLPAREFLVSGTYYMDFYCYYPAGEHGGSFCLNDPFEKQRALLELNKLAKSTKILAAKKYIDTFRRAINS